MALIRHFDHQPMERNGIHDEVEATYTVFQRDDRTFVQIDTYGRPDRELPGKKSQTIQLTRESASELIAILSEAFRFN
ncbi:methionyl-tRNA formyltransferase [Alsobacter soli]|uniref:Methionyl-tRNA formyltransferase n=1 Tax=Alsobacter soli TaxID=2109933 RepID=A0A2T1HWZ1_9HYPH|nr:methionyl-tRNA formyltransferase [Alsobacter soli]PSC06202.1 methionyl-tRNA formyltransferase [Alsobacter soli]